MCDFCHGTHRHRDACPRKGNGLPVVTPPPAPDEAVRIARRAVAHVAEVDRVLAGIRRDMMRPGG